MGAHDTGELNVVGLVGPGGCGSVCTAEDAAGNLVAVKYFEGMAIQRSVLSSMLGRLRQDGWPQGVMPILSSELEGSPAWVVMPLVADTDVDGTVRPRSLQYQVNGLPQKNTWDLLLRIARALAAMHEKRVAHGNLKPGNIFLDSSEKVMLSDWALGNMPRVSHLEFTDALLYQPPEQLREAEGYLEEAGYRWDVFAFGVLAFRLMTGEFPRCNDIFIKVAPSEGETRRDGIHADLEKIARNLELQPLVTWPKPPPDKEEESRRKLIVECLHLDPALRPSSMLDVLAGLEEAERSVAPEIEQTSPLNQFSHAERKRSWWRATACFAVGGCLLLGGLWLLAVDQLERAEKVRIKETSALRSKAETAVTAMEASEKALSEAKGALEYERKIGIARLEASRNIGDRLFSWAMEKGHRELPPLDGRLERLKALEKYFEDFLGRIGEIPQLEDERGRIKIQLAEIALAAGDSEKAISRLSKVPEAWKDNPPDEEYRLRMATNRLLLALLLKSNNDPRMADEFTAARKALGAVRKEEVDADRLQQLIAILDFHEANILSVRGETARALSQLMSATQSLNRLAAERPDAVVLRSVLATCYLSSATILEGMGNLGDARETQLLAAQEISRMLKDNPKDPGLRLDLAGCFGVMAEAALFSGDIAEAEARSTEAIRILQELLREQPDHVEAGSRLASQIGLKAGLMRDKGEADAALKLFDEALRMLEGICASHPDNPLAGYRLALLWWQKGKMLGMAGKRDSEIDLIRRAHGMMTRLEADKNPGGPPMEKIQRSSGYLLGDLGHALHLAGKNDGAIAAFAESASFWERLLKTRPKSEEYQESLTWCRQRIKELK
jgi:serine/threonine protein kinase